MKQRLSITATAWALTIAVIVPQVGFTMLTPALSQIAQDFPTSASSAHLVITCYLAGYAFSMLTCGVLADRFGPKRVQVWGLGLFTASSLLCAAAPSVYLMAATRFLQALGGCSATVLTRLIIQHRCPPAKRMRILTTLASAIALTPCLAPVAGGWLTEYVRWPGIFLVMAVLGSVAAVLVVAAVPADERSGRRLMTLREVLADYATSLRTGSYLGYAAAISLVSMAHVVFVSYSAHALEGGMGVLPTDYGGFLAVCAAGYVLGTAVVRRLFETYDLGRLLRLASLVCLAGGLLLVVATRAAPGQPWALVVPMTVVMFGVGVTVPASQAGLLRTKTGSPGNSAGLFFFIQLMTGTVYSLVAGRWPHMTAPGLAVMVALPCTVFPVAMWVARLAGANT